MEKILALASKVAEEAEVFTVSSEETQVRFEANKLKQLQANQRTSIALRLIKNGRLGYATATGTRDGQQLVDAAVETAAFGAAAAFHLPDIKGLPATEIFDPDVEKVPLDAMIEIGQQMVRAITTHTPGILCDAFISRGVSHISLINSAGGRATYRKSFFSLDISGTLVQGTDMLFVGDSESSCRPLMRTERLTDQVCLQLERARSRATAPTRTLPVIFTPDGVTALVFPLMAAFNGKNVLEGSSPVGGRLGQSVFDAKFHLYDDPTLAYRPASRPCDDEGIPSQRTTLVEKGVVRGFLYDLQTAGLAGVKSTGNGSRGRGLPAPSPSAFIITPGDVSFDDMVKDIKEGLVVEQLMGAEQGNILGGDFSGNVLLGYKVENGKIVGRVKDTMVSGNVYKVLKDIAAIGSEPKWVGGFLCTPPIYCQGIAVSSKKLINN